MCIEALLKCCFSSTQTFYSENSHLNTSIKKNDSEVIEPVRQLAIKVDEVKERISLLGDDSPSDSSGSSSEESPREEY